MKQLIILLVMASSTFGFAQHSRNWTIGVNASACLLNDDKVTLSKISVEPGYQWNQRLYASLSIAYVENQEGMHPGGTKFQGLMNSLSISSRLLKPEYQFSPVIGIEFGNIFYSNAKGARISRDLVICEDAQGELMGTFSNFRYFARMKYMLDIQLSAFNFRLGTTYSLSAVRMFDVVPDEDYSDILHGFGIESGLLYTINGKADREKKKTF